MKRSNLQYVLFASVVAVLNSCASPQNIPVNPNQAVTAFIALDNLDSDLDSLEVLVKPNADFVAKVPNANLVRAFTVKAKSQMRLLFVNGQAPKETPVLEIKGMLPSTYFASILSTDDETGVALYKTNTNPGINPQQIGQPILRQRNCGTAQNTHPRLQSVYRGDWVMALKKFQNAIDAVFDRLKSYETSLPHGLERQFMLNNQNGHSQILDLGWEDQKFVQDIMAHIDLREDFVWVQADNTTHGIVEALLKQRISKNRIVLGFHAPHKQPYTGFATGTQQEVVA
jgi:hypothetical protein